MKKRFFKILGLFLLALCVAGIILGGAVGFSAYREIRAQTFTLSEPTIPENAGDPAKGVPVGEPFQISFAVESAFSFEPDFHLEFNLPEGLETAGTVRRENHFEWKLRRSDVFVSLVAFEPGEFKDARIEIVAKSDEKTERKTIALPPIFAVLPTTSPDEKLSLAGKLDESADVSAGKSRLWLAAVLVPLLALALLIWIRRRTEQKPVPALPPWTITQNELDALKHEITEGKIGAVAAVTRLSDIVRHYLSRRFGMDADAMTSQEFFASMERYDSPLAANHKQFLREFLSAADMVKFAGFAATSEQTYNAIDRAASLVRETVPAPAEKK